VVVEIGILIAVSNVKVTCHNYCVSNIPNVLAKELKGSLVAIQVNIDYEI